MDDKTYLGTLAEAKVIAKLTEQKWFVFNQTSGKAPFDLVVYKDKKLQTISVKGCSRKDKYGSYLVTISRTRSNRTTNTVHKFDPNLCNILAVYLSDIDKVCFIPTCKISSGRQINLRVEPSKFSHKESFVIDSFIIMED